MAATGGAPPWPAVGRRRAPSCSTGTARSSHDVPVQRRPGAGRAGAGRPGGAGPAARGRAAARRGDATSPASPAACSPPRTSAAVNAAGRGAARAVRHLAGLPARRRRRLRAAASRRPAWCCAAARELGVRPERCVVVGDIGARHGRRAAPPAPPAILVPTPVTRPEEVGPRRRPWSRRPATAAVDLTCAGDAASGRRGGPAGAGRACSSSARTPPATCCSPARRSGPSRPAPTGDAAVRAARRGPPPAAARRRRGARVTGAVDRPDAPRRSTAADVAALVDRLAAARLDEAVVFTSFHQSPLPLALLLRLAGVPRITAISDDYPGSLLDVRHRVPAGDVPEPERALVARRRGRLPGCAGRRRRAVRGRCRGRDRRGRALGGRRLRRRAPRRLGAGPRPARRTTPRRSSTALPRAGHRVVVTGGAGRARR